MKTYGKRSGSVGIYYAKLDNLDEVELSDEGELKGEDISDKELSLQPAVQSTIDDTITHSSSESLVSEKEQETTVDVISAIEMKKEENTIESSIISPGKQEKTDELDIFDFLDKNNGTPKKIRKINHEKKSYFVDNLDSDDNEDLSKETIDSVNELLSSIKTVDDKQIENIFQEKFKQSSQDNTLNINGKVTYGNTRTMLKKKDDTLLVDEDEIRVEEETSEVESRAATDDNIMTQHFNDLKNMGDFLKYQDDLEFLTESKTRSLNSKCYITKLLNLSLAISNDRDFLQYIIKNNFGKVKKWCFCRYFSNPIALLLQGYLAVELQVEPNELPASFQNSIHLMLTEKSVPDHTCLKSKISRLNYKDFLRYTCSKPAQYYALKLYINYPAQLMSSEFVRKIYGIAGESGNTDIFFECVETLLSDKYQSNSIEDDGETRLLLESLIRQLSGYANREHLIKSMILLTNDSTNLSKVALDMRTFAYENCVDFILTHIGGITDHNVDLLILYLGLSLNIVTQCADIKPTESQWNDARELCHKLDKDDMNDNNRFITNMFYLNFVYMMERLGKVISRQEKSTVVAVLKRFDEESSKYNKSIHEKINIVLHNF